MAKVRLESVYVEKTPKKDIATPIATAFKKIRNLKSPLLRYELMQQRRRVKRAIPAKHLGEV
jgi:hypothetical protein